MASNSRSGTIQKAVCRLRQFFGQGDKVGHGIDAKEEPNIPSVVPPVQVLGLGEVGVTTEEERAEAGAPTQGGSLIDEACGLLVRGAIATAIDHPQRLLGVGQRDDQGVVAPDPVVGQVHTLLARGVGGDDRTISVNDRFLEELLGLLVPDPEAGLVDGVHQVQDVAPAEPPAEVSRGGGIGDPLGAQGIEVALVIASPFEMLELVSPGQDVEGDVQDVIGLMVRQVPFEELKLLVDRGDQPGPTGQQEHGTNTAAGQPPDPISQFILDIAGGDHGRFALRPGTIFDAAENSSLALTQFVQDIGIHSKASDRWNSEDLSLPPLFQETRGFSSFCSKFGPQSPIYHAWFRSKAS